MTSKNVKIEKNTKKDKTEANIDADNEANVKNITMTSSSHTLSDVCVIIY